MAKTSRILVVDDESETRDLLKLMLQKEGYAVLGAGSWDEVADVVEQTYRKNAPIDLILLDLMLPDRSGFDIMRSLQVALQPMPPVIMLSAVTGIDQQIQARDLGVTRYLTKPTTRDKLFRAIKDILKKS